MDASLLQTILVRTGIAFSLLALAACAGAPEAKDESVAFEIFFDAGTQATVQDGRIILIIAVSDESEPRFQSGPDFGAAQIFGVDVEALAPGQRAIIDGDVLGFPAKSLGQLPAGDYIVQAVLHKYETFDLASGHTVKLPMDRGEGQHWNRAPGNLYSTPQSMHFDPAQGGRIEITLDQVIPPITPPEDTKYIRHVTMKSDLLSEFWGRPMELGAHVLLPEGFDEHGQARYPLAIWHGHFPADFRGFRETPPNEDMECVNRRGVECYNRVVQQEAYDFYRKWTGPDFPRMIIMLIQHPTPYYDDSYAVNSASQGPWGDAITHELVPFIEERFRGIGEGWARFLYGGSTGGWEALAAQVFYPDDYNGTFAACPDSVDFRAHQIVNIYDDGNAYWNKGPFGAVARPGRRNWLGQLSYTMADENHYELVLGTKNRSGMQWDVWEATFSPQGTDGYPDPLWDKLSGEINPEIAEYWRENYDLRHILERDWATLGPKLEGKIHIYSGDMDNYYLNNAAYLIEDFLEGTTNPYYGGLVDYGDRREHCWNGDHVNPNAIASMRYNTMYVPRMMELIEAHAPEGADLESWRY